MLLLLLILVVLAAVFFGCGGGGSTSSGPVQDPGTAPGTYQVAITVTSSGSTVGSGTLTVTVQ